MGIAINARFQTQALTGVQRYALEITQRLGPDFRQLVPPRPLGSISGHLWEQSRLPLERQGELLWSPANTGPLAVTDQVLSLHDLSFLDFPQGYSRAFLLGYRFLIPRLVRRVRHIITVSHFSRQRIEQALGVPGKRITVIAEAASESFTPQSEPRVKTVLTGLQLNRPYILALGGLSQRKNFSVLLRVWPQIRKHHPELELVVIGSPEALYKKEPLSPTEGVRALPRVPDADLPALYQGARCFVYPSLYEGFGLPILEAMAVGTPVICSNSTALPETAGQAAILVSPSKANELGSRLLEVLADKQLRAELSARGAEHAATFSWDRAANQTRELLQSFS